MIKTRLYRLAFRVLPRVPRPLLLWLAPVAGGAFWLVSGGARATVRANLAHIPRLAGNPALLNRMVRRCFTNLVLNYIDLFVPPPQGLATDLSADFVAEGLSTINEAVAQGKGVILFSLHTAAFERARYRMRQLFPNHAMVGPMEALDPPELFDLIATARGQSDMTFLPISSGETLRTLIKTLRQGGVVLLAIDRDVTGTGVVMPFFGAPARLPTGIVSLARHTGAAVVCGICWRDGVARYRGWLRRVPLALSGSAQDDDATRAALAPLIALMESEIAAHPDQWLASFARDIWVAPDSSYTTAAVSATESSVS